MDINNEIESGICVLTSGEGYEKGVAGHAAVFGGKITAKIGTYSKTDENGDKVPYAFVLSLLEAKEKHEVGVNADKEIETIDEPRIDLAFTCKESIDVVIAWLKALKETAFENESDINTEEEYGTRNTTDQKS